MADMSALRGYDSFRVSLGDEMRGRRASLGKSLLDVQRELRIRAAHVEAIENADPSGVPYAGFVTGYVRAYARYLGMDEDDALRRFCLEAGYTPQVGPQAKTKSGPKALSAAVATPRADLDALIAGSRLAAVGRAEALATNLGSTLRAASSLAVLLLLIGAIGYGGWTVLRNIQQVEFAPSPEAPAALTEGPDLAAGGVVRASLGPAPVVDAEALAAIYAAQEAPPPRLAPRDGPIAALDPGRAGIYAAARARLEPAVAGADEPRAPATPLAPAVAAVGDAVPPASESAAGVEAAPAASEAAAAPAGPPALVFEGEVWVRIRDGRGRTIHEALTPAGRRWTVPEGAEGLTVRAGNAGGLYVEIGGVRYGPLGGPGQVVSDVSLDPETVRETFPRADQPVVAEADSAG